MTGIFSPGERETFERIATALEDCADSLKKIANPLFILKRDVSIYNKKTGQTRSVEYKPGHVIYLSKDEMTTGTDSGYLQPGEHIPE